MRNIEYSIAEVKLLCEEYKNAACAGKDGKLGALKEEIQTLVDEIEKEAPRVNNDSAFFAGELNAKLGEKEVEHPEHVKAYRERRDRRMTHKRIDAEEEERKGGHGNTHIPFGLCQREGIAVQPGWTPRDAWSALKGKGYDIGSVYRELRETGKVAPRGAASSQYNRPAAQEKALGRIAKKTAGLKREQYRIVDQDGNVVLENRGDRHSVPSTVGEKREHLPGNVSIHNHPDGGTFSPDDLRDFGYGAREMVVAGPDGAYSLVNAKYGTKEQSKGWYDMQQALIKACPETSTLKLLQQARKNLESCEERKRMSAISEEFVRRKDAGESTDELKEWINGTGYDELETRYKEKLGAEQRRLEVEPFHKFYQENAEKYGFLYRFTPKGGDLFERTAERAKGAVERMRSEPDAPTMEKDMEAQGYTKNAEGHWVKRSDAADRERMDAIERYRLRREKRLSRMDEEGRWVTTENDHKVHINDEGVPDKGNPHVLAAMNKGRVAKAPKTTMKHDGTVVDNHMSDFRNPHVEQADRDFVRNAMPRWIDAGRFKYSYYDHRKFFTAGQQIRDEVIRRAKLRKKAKDEGCDGKPQIEDIYDVLRDARQFGKPDGFERLKVRSELSKERTDAIIREATDRFPTDWYDAIYSGEVTVMIHDCPGRSCFSTGDTWCHEGASAVIHLFAREHKSLVEDLKLESDEIADYGLVNTLAHELGHYFEWANDSVGDLAKRCLETRTEKSESEYLEPGYDTKPDSFFRRYMGKQYYTGTTEITSMLMECIGYGNPFEYMTGKGLFSDAKDPESLKFILGVLGGL